MGRSIMRYVRRHHVALLALFVALSGSSVATASALLPRNSVGTAHLQNGAVTKNKVAKSAVAKLKVRRDVRGRQGLKGGPGRRDRRG